jgi:hypothetical protein
MCIFFVTRLSDEEDVGCVGALGVVEGGRDVLAQVHRQVLRLGLEGPVGGGRRVALLQVHRHDGALVHRVQDVVLRDSLPDILKPGAKIRIIRR